MTNYREILRLSSLGLNNTQIAQSCACSRTTVIQTLRLVHKSLPQGSSAKIRNSIAILQENWYNISNPQ